MNGLNPLQKSLHKGLIIALLVSCVLGFWTEVAKASLFMTADSAIVIDAETGKVLWEKNSHQRRPPASTTKIMTTILGIELGNLEDRIKASHKAASQEGSSIYLKAGEELTLEHLLYGIMLNSGNDAAVVVAEYIAGSVEEFAELMNRKGKEIGALNTTFKNPNGLPDNEHLTTAYDLAMIMRYGMQNEFFRTLNAAKTKTIPWPGNDWARGLRNHNKLLWEYAGADGGKTGYTRAAGRCLVSSASRDGRRVIAVVLHADQLWEDSIRLLDYGLNNFANVTLITAGEVVHSIEMPESREKILNMVSARDLRVTVPIGQDSKATTSIKMIENLQLPIMVGQKVGVMEIEINGEKIGQVDLVAKDALTEVSVVRRFWRWVTSIFKGFA